MGQQWRETDADTAALKRLAMQLAVQLPASPDDAERVLKMCLELVAWQRCGGGGGSHLREVGADKDSADIVTLRA